MRRVARAGAVIAALAGAALLGVILWLEWRGARRLELATRVRDRHRVHAVGQDATFRTLAERAAPWGRLEGEVPEGPGCQFAWLAHADERVRQHVTRCGGPPQVLSAALGASLKTLGDQAVARSAEVPAFERSFEWMKSLRGNTNWLALRGTPYDFVEPGKPFLPGEAPVPDCGSARTVALLRLVAAARAGELEEGKADVAAFARALLGAPLFMANQCGLGVLRVARRQLEAAGAPADGVFAADAIAALEGSRRVAAWLWHPWVDPAARASLVSSLGPLDDCVAAFNGLAFLAAGPALDRRYPGLRDEFDRWSRRSQACPAPIFSTVRDAQGPEAWRQALLPSSAVEGSVEARLQGAAARLSRSWREALVEDRLGELPPPLVQPDGGVGHR